jgi:hypothetical protein
MAQMRFAEHMLLESSNHTLKPYLRHQDGGARCAVGLVELDGSKDETAERKYPWIARTLVRLPCGCGYVQGGPYAVTAIVHLFNEHVARGVAGYRGMVGGVSYPDAEPWTLDRLAQWIDSVDPTPRSVGATETTTVVGSTELEEALNGNQQK